MPKSIEIADIKLDQLKIMEQEVEDSQGNMVDGLRIIAETSAVDSKGKAIPKYHMGGTSETRPLTEVPANILQGLNTIKQYMLDKARTEEGL